jgi:hypothetical protein
VFGRLGFCLNDREIEAELRRRLADLAAGFDPKRLTRDQRVILVSSLGGGTGAGMVIDIAYLARRQDGAPKVFGYFLMPEVFQGVELGGRTYANTYACLKEMAYLKDQQIPFRGDYFRIPSCEFEVGEEEPFARTFLYQGQAEGNGAGITKAASALADAIFGQLNSRIQDGTLARVSNTTAPEVGDSDSGRRTHCFSTVTSTGLMCKPVTDVRELVGALMMDVFERPAAFEAATRGELAKSVERVERHLHLSPLEGTPDWSVSEQGLAARMARWVEHWSQWIHTTTTRSAEEVMKYLSDVLAPGSGAGNGAPTMDEIARLVFEDHHNDRYLEQTFPNCAALVTYLKEEEAFKSDVKNVLQIAMNPAEPDGAGDNAKAVRKKTLLSQLSSLKGRFDAMPTDDSELVALSREHESYKQELDQAVKQTRSKLGKVLLPNFEREFETGKRISRQDMLNQALSHPACRQRVASILHVRLAAFLAGVIDSGLNEAEAVLRHQRSFWTSPPFKMRLQRCLVEEHGDLRNRAEELLSKHIALLADHFPPNLTPDAPVNEQLKFVREILGGVLRQGESDLRVQLDQDATTAEDKLRELLVKAQQRVFETRTPPTGLTRSFTFILVPDGLFWPKGDLDALENFLRATTQQLLGCEPQINRHLGNSLWVYHEDLYHRPEDIRNIDEYYRQYEPHLHKELFHIDRRMLQQPLFRREIHGRFSTAKAVAVRCGNAGCDYDISPVSRTEAACPGCSNPIRSRCGNENCGLDRLHERKERNEKSCPECHGFNHAAWWCCNRHERMPFEISIEKERCPRCIEEHNDEPLKRRTSEISMRPDIVLNLTCPSCMDIKGSKPGHTEFRVRPDLRPFYLDGVSGHDSEAFRKLAEKYKLPDGFRCPQCRAHLIPVHHHNMVLDGSRSVN